MSRRRASRTLSIAASVCLVDESGRVVGERHHGKRHYCNRDDDFGAKRYVRFVDDDGEHADDIDQRDDYAWRDVHLDELDNLDE